MKTKMNLFGKSVALMLAVLMLASFPCMQADASGLFADIVNQVKQGEPKPLPSFTVYSHRSPQSETATETGFSYMYNKVSLNEFSDFGVYLQKQSYTVSNQYNVGKTYIIEISEVLDQGVVAVPQSFVLKYDVSAETLEMCYNKDAQIVSYAFMNEVGYATRNGTNLVNDSTVDVFGNTYGRSFSMTDGEATFSLDKQYSVFAGTIAYPGEQTDNWGGKIEIFGDGKSLYSSDYIYRTTYPVEFEVDITGVTVLTINWSDNGRYSSDHAAYAATIYNGIFH